MQFSLSSIKFPSITKVKDVVLDHHPLSSVVALSHSMAHQAHAPRSNNAAAAAPAERSLKSVEGFNINQLFGGV